MRTLARALLPALSLAAIFGLAGCSSVTFQHPVGTAPVSLEEEDINGAWYPVIPEGVKTSPFYVRYIKPGELRMGLVDWKDDQFRLKQSPVYIRKEGDSVYLSVPENPASVEADQGYVFARLAKFSKAEWVVWLPNIKAFRDAVRQGELEGERSHGDVKLSGSSAELFAFLQAHPEGEVWSETERLILRRFPPPQLTRKGREAESGK